MARPLLTTRVSIELEENLLFCAKELNKKKSELINEALAIYLEDLKDYIHAKKILADNQSTITHEELKRELGI